jgi:hypothetical protein
MIDVSCSVAHSRRDLLNPATNPCDSTVRWSCLLPPVGSTKQNRKHTQSNFYCRHTEIQWVRKIGLPIGKNRKHAYIEYVTFTSLAREKTHHHPRHRVGGFHGTHGHTEGIATRCLIRAKFLGRRSFLKRRGRL